MSRSGCLITITLLLGTAAWGAATAAVSSEDAVIETALLEGEIVRTEDLGSGITRSKRLWIEHQGVEFSAVFKDIDVRNRGITRFASGNAELNFTDSYLYERAAYLLDRELGLGMVPVAVLRKVPRREGAVIQWLSNAITEQQRVDEGLRPPDMSMLLYQWADMRLFDALIYNTDRHAANQLYTLGDWRLRLIDHSRAFRTAEELPEDFRIRPTTLTRSVHEQLQGLDEAGLKALLKSCLGPTQIESMLLRRDLILEKVERDRAEYGDAHVFREAAEVE